MCGIMGYKGRPTLLQMTTMVNSCNDRGGHSWGFFFRGKEDLILKGTGLMDRNLILSIFQRYPLGIGISRLSTSYDTSLMESQPILLQDKVLVHNGVVEGFEGEGLDTYEVFNAINKGKKVGAVLWIDKNHLKVHTDLIPLYHRSSKRYKVYSSKPI